MKVCNFWGGDAINNCDYLCAKEGSEVLAKPLPSTNFTCVYHGQKAHFCFQIIIFLQYSQF
jgi:hypothetical protein